MRVQLALNVKNLERSVAYYAKMFGTQPYKVRKGYANFAIDDPSLKLVLFENPEADEHLNHLGVETFDPDEIDDTAKRFESAGILQRLETDAVCCHANQHKVWTKEPQGLGWEWYVINDDDPVVEAGHGTSPCCSGRSKADSVCR